MNWRRFTSSMGSSPEPAVPAYRRLRMRWKRPQVLGVDLNCSESGGASGTFRVSDQRMAHLAPLHPARLKDDPRDVPTGSCKTIDIAARDRIKINGDQHDRNGAIGGQD